MGIFSGNKNEKTNNVENAGGEGDAEDANIEDILAPEGSTEDLPTDVAAPAPDSATGALQELTGKLLRLQADFDNFRRRNNQARAEAREDTRRDVMSGLLPVYDNFLRALEHADQSKDYDALRSGIDGIRLQMESFFKSQGLETIPAAAGETFDPTVHDAAGMVPGGQPNTVAQELVRGFQLNGTVVRPAQVLVHAPEE